MTLSTTNLRLAPDAAIDLQLHTTYSDGRWTAEQLLDYLRGEQFGLVAITDHDCAETAVSPPSPKHFSLLRLWKVTAKTCL